MTLTNQVGQCVTHMLQSGYLCVNLSNFLLRLAPNITCRCFFIDTQCEQLTDFIERKAQLLRPFDKAQALYILRRIHPIAGIAPWWLGQQATPFVITQCFNVDTRSFSEFACG